MPPLPSGGGWGEGNFWIILIALFALVGCQPQSANDTLAAQSEGAAIELIATEEVANTAPTLLPTPTLIKPAVVYTQPPPANQPSFALADATKLAQQAASTQEAMPTETAVSTAPIESEPTATPAPTFTPPALYLTSAEEHYWFRRPVPEGGTVWTDKVYPYGSSRGGLLRTHHGVEFNVPSGTAVLAAASGTVRVAGDDLSQIYGPHANFYGNLVVIEHDSLLNGQPVFTLYGHLSDVFVAVGQHVDSQQTIANSGGTGVADGPHLHFEVRQGQNSYDTTRNPLLWLYPFPFMGTLSGRVVWPDGSLVGSAPVSINRIDAPSRYMATTSYADNTVNADVDWGENFALDDVEPGYYEVVVNAGDKKYKAEVWVYAYRTAFVEIMLDTLP